MGYRYILERLDQFFPNKELLTVTDLMRFTGLDRRAVKKVIPFTGKYICKTDAARLMAA